METASALVEHVAYVRDSMPSGVTVARDGRIFLCFPRWVDNVPFTVGELHGDGSISAFPDALRNRLGLWDSIHHFISVQSVQASRDGTLWVLDTGRPYYMPALPGGAKLVEVDIVSGALRRTYVIPHGIARFTTYLNDFRIAQSYGNAGTVFITDSAIAGPSAFIVIDIATGKKMRRLDNHATVNPDPAVDPIIDRERLKWRFPLGLTFPYRNGVDGIALSPDEKTLYYCPLSSRHLYSLDAAMLADPSQSDAAVAATIRDLGEKSVSDGLECDAAGCVYASDIEHRQIMRRTPAGAWSVFARDDRMLWTDTLCIADDGFLYFTANQVQRMWPFHAGRDMRERPYAVLRARM